MSKTKELAFGCEEFRTIARNYRLRIFIDEPDIDELLSCIDGQDLIAHVVAGGYKPAEVFDEEALEKWAEENGYTKENN